MTGSRNETLRAVYREPNARAALKVLDHLDVHCRNFIALSPFLVLSTASAQGRTDASPRGDPPGFVAAPDEHTLLIPDRPGNNQIDSLRNLAEQPHVGLLFFVPGMNETLRVKGTAEIVTDADRSGAARGRRQGAGSRPCASQSRRPFLHCGRALDPLAAMGSGGTHRTLRLSHLRTSPGRPDRRRQRPRHRRRGRRGQPHAPVLGGPKGRRSGRVGFQESSVRGCATPEKAPAGLPIGTGTLPSFGYTITCVH